MELWCKELLLHVGATGQTSLCLVRSSRDLCKISCSKKKRKKSKRRSGKKNKKEKKSTKKNKKNELTVRIQFVVVFSFHPKKEKKKEKRASP